jgi:hypothetical protein
MRHKFYYTTYFILPPSRSMCHCEIQNMSHINCRSRFPVHSAHSELMHIWHNYPHQGTKPSAVRLIIKGNRVFCLPHWFGENSHNNNRCHGREGVVNNNYK